jgi:predicted transcriptional regulator
MPANVPDKIKIAKMAKLIGRGLVDGCPCGCRGNYVITEKGIEYLTKQVEA